MDALLSAIADSSTDAEEYRKLGAHLMALAWKQADPAVLLGWLVSDWMRLIEARNNLDRSVNSPIECGACGATQHGGMQ